MPPVTVRNLPSFAEQELELKPGLVVIVGPNGVGKSNHCSALALAGLALEWRRNVAPGCLSLGGSIRSSLAGFGCGRFGTGARRRNSLRGRLLEGTRKPNLMIRLLRLPAAIVVGVVVVYRPGDDRGTAEGYIMLNA